MNLTYLFVRHEISDEAAAHLSELLNDLAFAFDGQLLFLAFPRGTPAGIGRFVP